MRRWPPLPRLAPVPRYKVHFKGPQLTEEHIGRLVESGVDWQRSGSEIRDGVLHVGAAYHDVLAEAEDEAAAEQAVRAALGPDAGLVSDFSAVLA